MKECGVYHCEKHEEGKTCILAWQLHHQAQNRVIGSLSLSKENIELFIDSTLKMAKDQGCSCIDQVDEAVLFARGVIETIPEDVG